MTKAQLTRKKNQHIACQTQNKERLDYFQQQNCLYGIYCALNFSSDLPCIGNLDMVLLETNRGKQVCIY